ncbi:tocopherol cyclase family protein [Leptolyngbya sp. AN02str]|uniref:tocopherol cyclase family protein n=1 Tax=Leptolyngbya sp. AN02str TaxID=3423363 RepID=UPI003D31C8FB
MAADTPSTSPSSNRSHFAHLQTPHSGYHWTGSSDRFFEGWYTRLTLPACKDSFAFMYSIEDPIGGQPHSGGCAQVLGPNDAYFCRTLPNVQQFWAWPNALGVGHWRKHRSPAPKPQFLQGDRFFTHVHEGYQLTATHHQGQLYNPRANEWIRWQYTIQPIYGWGSTNQAQQSTAGWLSQFPIFEPGWQILMAHGYATGWIDWLGKCYEFVDAPVYSEKNWGSSFPGKWFWIQCNSFESQPDLTLTAVGSLRHLLGLQETVGMVGVHHQQQFYEFVPWNAQIRWTVHPWGIWKMTADNGQYVVTLNGIAPPHSATTVRVPSENGMVFNCRDTTHGELTLQLYQKQANQLHLICEAHSQAAGLETGGEPWHEIWERA